MRTARTFSIAIVLSIFSMVSVVWAQTNPLDSPAVLPKEPAASSSPTGRALFTAKPPADPGMDFDEARASFLRMDAAEAVARIRTGAAIMRDRAANATDNTRNAMYASARELEGLALGVENRMMASVQRMDEAFSRAHIALAEHHFLQAMRDRELQAQHRMGENLRLATEQLQHGAERAGVALRNEERAVVDTTKALAGKLKGGMDASREEVRYGMTSFANSMDNLRARMTGIYSPQRDPNNTNVPR